MTRMLKRSTIKCSSSVRLNKEISIDNTSYFPKNHGKKKKMKKDENSKKEREESDDGKEKIKLSILCRFLGRKQGRLLLEHSSYLHGKDINIFFYDS